MGLRLCSNNTTCKQGRWVGSFLSLDEVKLVIVTVNMTTGHVHLLLGL